jgi:antitoxin (DNA-binding transcriptional repressor) of toxin-antitoxin stability system
MSPSRLKATGYVDKITYSPHFAQMKATLSELHRETRRIARPVIHGGEEVILTDFEKPVARIVPFLPVVTVSPLEARVGGVLDDDAILTAFAEAREEDAERLDP